MTFCNTSHGLLPLEKLKQLNFLSHEHLFHNLTRFASNNHEKLNLENSSIWKADSFTFSTNVVLNNLEEINTELKKIYNLNELCIVECSAREDGDLEKLMELSKLEGLTIITGYNFKDQASNEIFDANIAVYNKNTLLKQIQLEFALGSNEIRPSFLGPLYLDRLNLSHKLTLLHLEVYGNFMKETGVSLLIDMRFAQKKEDEAKLKRVLEILNENGGLFENTLVANYPIFYTISTENFILKFQINNSDSFHFFLKSGLVLFFDLSLFISSPLPYLSLPPSSSNFDFPLSSSSPLILALLLRSLLPSYPSQLILSSGITFKSDLYKYGGEGFAFFPLFLQGLGLDEKTREKLGGGLWKEKLSVFKEKEEKKEEEKLVKCVKCGEGKKKEDLFGKMGKDFCSMKCLREFFK